MDYLEDLNPINDKEFVCNVCDEPIDEPGVCSRKCWQSDNM
jgi:hypothetical protein